MPLFLSEPWIDRLVDRINASDGYRSAGSRWNGGVALVVRGLEAPNGVALDLAGGACRGARPIVGAVPAEPRMVLEGDLATWKRLLGGDMEPISAVLRGRLKLSRGSLTELLPQAEGAKQLLLAARQVETTFLDEVPRSPGAGAPTERPDEETEVEVLPESDGERADGGTPVPPAAGCTRSL